MDTSDKTPQASKTTNLRLRGTIAAALVLMLLATAVPVTADHEPWHAPSEPVDFVIEPVETIFFPFIRKCERVEDDDTTGPYTGPFYPFLTEVMYLFPIWVFPVIGEVSCWDYGDAPDSSESSGRLYPTGYPFGNPHGWFPTTADTQNSVWPGQPGARHQYVDVAWLGDINASNETDCNAPPTREYDADKVPTEDHPVRNLNPYSLTPDRDTHDNGLYNAYLPAATTGSITVRVSACEDIERWFVNVLVDWDFDGRWSDYDIVGFAPEWAVQNAPVGVSGGTSQDFTFPILTGVMPGKPWVRVTLTERPIEQSSDLGWDGSVPPGHFDDQDRPGFLFGETEDYCGSLQTFRFDGADPDHRPCIDREG